MQWSTTVSETGLLSKFTRVLFKIPTKMCKIISNGYVCFGVILKHIRECFLKHNDTIQMAVAASAAQLRSGHSSHSSHVQAYKHLTDPSVNPKRWSTAYHWTLAWLPRQSTSPFGDLWHCWTASSVDSLIIPGQVGRTDKAHIVTPWCTCHHQQQQQQNVRLTTAVTYREVDAGIIIDLLDVSQSLV